MSRRTSRFVPFLIALTVCAASAVALGFSAWYLFGKNPAAASNKRPQVISESPAGVPAGSAPANANTSKESSPSSAAPLPGTLFVAGATVEIGGTDPTAPAQKVAVDSFFISETEVTNHQYQEFVKETNHSAPGGWKDGDFPPGAANEPVTEVTWQDAVDYCQWLSTKVGAVVRLPLEAEWELAARGPQGFKYPWGNEWDDRAAASESKHGFVHAVKSYPAGRSPCGAYDMAGNVWEWVADVRDPEDKTIPAEHLKNRIIKGGAANEQQELITAASRNLIPKDYAGTFLGFRYVVLRS
jgi:formylglycine-generating enzyme required for sulfatase activity